MYFGDHSIRFYENEETVGIYAYDEDQQNPDTWNRWHLIPTEKPIIQPPESDLELTKIMGRNGLTNLSKYIYKSTTYGNCTGSIEFVIDPDFSDNWPVIYEDLKQYFHGKEIILVQKDDRYFFRRGWFTCKEMTPGEYWDTFTLDYSIDPFKYERWSSMDNWLWADFRFADGIVRNREDYILSMQPGETMTQTIPVGTPGGVKRQPEPEVKIRAEIGGWKDPGTIGVHYNIQYTPVLEDLATNPKEAGYYEQSGTAPNYIYTPTEDMTLEPNHPVYFVKTQDGEDILADGLEHSMTIEHNVADKITVENHAGFTANVEFLYYDGSDFIGHTIENIPDGGTRDFYMPEGDDSSVIVKASAQWPTAEFRTDGGVRLFADNTYGEANIDGSQHNLYTMMAMYNIDIPEDGMMLYVFNPTKHEILVLFWYVVYGKTVKYESILSSSGEASVVIPEEATDVDYMLAPIIRAGTKFSHTYDNWGSPKDKGYYERSGANGKYVYTLTDDTSAEAGKDYYKKTEEGKVIIAVSSTQWRSTTFIPDADNDTLLIENISGLPLNIYCKYRGASL